MLAEPIFQHNSRVRQVVRIAPLATELEYGLAALTEVGRGRNGNLMIGLDHLGKANELGRGDQSGEIRIGRDVQIGLERNVLLVMG